MNVKKGLVGLFVLTFVMCLAIYQIRNWEAEEYRAKYENQIKNQRISSLEQENSKLQEMVIGLPKSSNNTRNSKSFITEDADGVIDDAKTGIDKRLTVPKGGNDVNPVIIKHVEDLKSKNLLNIDPKQAAVIAFSKLEPRETVLTSEEEKLMKICVKNGPRDRSNNGSRFFGPGEVIRRNHHTYLNKNKLMIEVGGNWGWDAGNFSKIYNPRYLILEPLAEYVGILRRKFADNPQVSVYNLGLGAKNESLLVNIEGNNACATSKFSTKKGTVPIYIINAVDFFAGVGVGAFEVDLLTLNCEGCEYEALETLLASNIIKSFRNIQWATHSTLKMKDPIGRYCRIEQLLLRTHRPTYQYRLIWESWRRRDL